MRLHVYCLPLLLVLGPPQGQSRGGRLDATKAFYYPQWVNQPDTALGKTSAGPIASATYLRYLAGRLGTRYLEDLAFEIALEQECAALGLARSAPLLARSMAARRFHESGRRQVADPDGSLQRKFANESLQRLRVDALVGAKRMADSAALQRLFDRRYGVGGHRVQVRQVLVSLEATRRRLESKNQPAGQAEVLAAARARARALHQRAKADGIATVMGNTDERVARRMLRDPKRSAAAGVLEGYNYVRYGEVFAEQVRALEVSGLSAPLLSETGFHIVELLSRKTTRLADVEAALRAELSRGPAKPADVQALRKELLVKYGFTPAGGPR